MEEQWKPVVGFEGYYEVSSKGNVRSVERDIKRSDGVVTHYDSRLMTLSINTDGYYQVKLSKDHVSRYYGVHRLVAMAFIDNPSDLPEVNHIDAIRTHNDVDNLEWCTHGDNVRYSIQLGNHFCTRDLTGENNPNYHNTTLKEFYASHPEEALKLGQPGSQNGRARSIRCITPGGDVIDFDWIGGCAEYLREIGVTSNKINTLRDQISAAIRCGQTYKGYSFAYV